MKPMVQWKHMTMTNTFSEKLAEFHEAVATKVNSPCNKQEFVTNSDIAQLRAALIKEEADELITALLEEDLHQVRKEIADLLYVTFGTAEVFGIPVDDDFSLVHANNMLKVRNASFRDDGKLVKSPNHPKVKFPSIENDG